jgi:structural maintenance of chromosome 2
LQATNQEIADAQVKIPEVDQELVAAKAETEEAKQVVENARKILDAADKEKQKIQRDKKAAAKEKSDAKLGLQKLDHELKTAEENLQASTNQLDRLMNDNDWLESEIDKYDKTPGNADVRVDVKKIKDREREIAKAQEKENKLSRNVNVKAMNMLGQMEDKVRSRLIVSTINYLSCTKSVFLVPVSTSKIS